MMKHIQSKAFISLVCKYDSDLFSWDPSDIVIIIVYSQLINVTTPMGISVQITHVYNYIENGIFLGHCLYMINKFC